MREAIRLKPTFRMLAEEKETAELMLYGEIVSDMPEEWKWSKEDKSAADFDKAIKDIKAGGAKNLNIRINSPGGVVSEAIAMRSIITGAGFENIHIRIEGLCASAATDIATIPGADVEITKGSEYMIHNPWTISYGNADEMEKTVEHLRQLEKTSRDIYVQRSGQTEEQVKEWMDAETWFTAEQAVEYGFCDRIAEENAMPAAASADMMRVIRGMYQRVPDTLQEEPEENVSNGNPVAGCSSENTTQEVETMEQEINMETLTAENPALLEQIRQEAVASERQRIEDIDALTLPGYEELARQCKADGTSAMEFQKRVVAQQKQKGAEYLQNRAKETAPAQNVQAGAADTAVNTSEEDEIKAFAKEAKEMYESVRGNAGGMF